MKSGRRTVLLVVGGDSPERDVSVETGKSVFEALGGLGHRVFVVDPYRSEIAPTEDPTVLFDNAHIDSEPPRLSKDIFRGRARFLQIIDRFDQLGCEIVFNALHGGAGEDGTFQAVLDYLGVPYTGSGACASALAMNKELSKRIVALDRVPVAKQIFVGSQVHEMVVTDKHVLKALSLPVVVKPNYEGSSVGVTIVQTIEELPGAIEAAKEFDGPYLIEQFIEGSEITAAVLDGARLPLLEIRPGAGFFDYRNKYTTGACEYIVPAPLDKAVYDAIDESAVAAHRALGCRGYARVDFRVTPEGEHFFLEANTLPGLTANSLVPKAARGAGIEFPELIDRILHLSLTANAV